jgi:hypothetical protein
MKKKKKRKKKRIIKRINKKIKKKMKILKEKEDKIQEIMKK